MKKIFLLSVVFFPIVAVAFNDGLPTPNSVLKYELDELQTGISTVEIFSIDINRDGIQDRIIKTTYSNISSHGYYEYELELAVDEIFTLIGNFRTIENANGSLQKVRFIFDPRFQTIVISRPVGKTLSGSTLATKNIYELDTNGLIAVQAEQLSETNDVAELF